MNKSNLFVIIGLVLIFLLLLKGKEQAEILGYADYPVYDPSAYDLAWESCIQSAKEALNRCLLEADRWEDECVEETENTRKICIELASAIKCASENPSCGENKQIELVRCNVNAKNNQIACSTGANLKRDYCNLRSAEQAAACGLPSKKIPPEPEPVPVPEYDTDDIDEDDIPPDPTTSVPVVPTQPAS